MTVMDQLKNMSQASLRDELVGVNRELEIATLKRDLIMLILSFKHATDRADTMPAIDKTA